MNHTQEKPFQQAVVGEIPLPRDALLLTSFSAASFPKSGIGMAFTDSNSAFSTPKRTGKRFTERELIEQHPAGLFLPPPLGPERGCGPEGLMCIWSRIMYDVFLNVIVLDLVFVFYFLLFLKHVYS